MAIYEFVLEEGEFFQELKKYSIVRKDLRKFSLFATNEREKLSIEKVLNKKKFFLKSINWKRLLIIL